MAQKPLEIEGLPGLIKGMPSLLKSPLEKEVLRPAAELARRTAAANSPGSVARSWSSRVDSGSAAVFSSANPGQVNTLESGRAVGAKAPPVESLSAWAGKVGFGGSLFVLAQSIKRRGRKGLFFIRNAKSTTEGALPRLLAAMTKRVESDFSKLGGK